MDFITTSFFFCIAVHSTFCQISNYYTVNVLLQRSELQLNCCLYKIWLFKNWRRVHRNYKFKSTCIILQIYYHFQLTISSTIINKQSKNITCRSIISKTTIQI